MSEEKAINKKDLNRGYVYFGNSTLEIGVQNLGQLKDLISNVEFHQTQLQEAVRELSRFELKINFQQTQPIDPADAVIQEEVSPIEIR